MVRQQKAAVHLPPQERRRNHRADATPNAATAAPAMLHSEGHRAKT
jgi:hypothetical protein